MTEVFTARFVTSLTSAISTTSRPVTVNVAATLSAFGSGTYSMAIYDAGTDAAPVNFEAFEVTANGSTLAWTATTETGWTATTHASGSTVVATILTPRALQQQLVDHTTPATIADPHSIYIRKATYTAKGDVVIGTGAGTYTVLTVGADGTTPVADSTRPTGWRWANNALTSVLQHMGDLIVGGVLGAATRLGIGTAGQVLATQQNTPAITDPSTAPNCNATGSGGSLVNGSAYDFAYAWQTANPTPDGGITLVSPITTFTATSTGTVAVQAPAAPAANTTLVVYAATHSGTLTQQATLPNASTSSTNTINVSSIVAGAATSGTNTTGGITAVWTTIAGTGTVTSVGLSVPSEFTITGSPVTGAGTLIVQKQIEQPNQVWAGPVSGISQQPSFRPLVPADMPIILEHEEFLPSSGALTVSLTHIPSVILMVSRGGTVQSVAAGNYSQSGPTITFGSSFSGSERVVVAYSHVQDQSVIVVPGAQSFALPPTARPGLVASHNYQHPLTL